MTTEPDLSYISPGLRHLAVPIDSLEHLPGNPRKGNVTAVAKLLKRFGQRKPVTVNVEDDGKRIVTAGNTTLRAARDVLQWEWIAAEETHDSSEDALAWSLGDNRSHDLGSYDAEASAAMLKRLVMDESLLDVAGYTREEVESLVPPEGMTRTEFEDLAGDEEDAKPQNVVIQYNLVFSSEYQQQTWYSLLRWLKQTQDGDTIATRLTAFIEGLRLDEE